ncbi:MAG: UDP-4-amino-4,6-dideoxy-N-acetyl-beta-L-altrosamine N-acetyltransferase [candidate division Zixibacteria bacterium]|nr:UDP-4-amino-4,6-dideoxy-N-acetyl-beta-L-altrosamine N-acetyltransferase [candidate division Zixibacteria bacterium]
MSPHEEYRLRPMVEADLDMVLTWRNKPHIREMMYRQHMIGRQEHLGWYVKIKDDPTSVYLIFEHLGRPIGLANFTKIDHKARSCMWGFYLGEDDRPRGAGTVLGMLSLDYAFETIGVGTVIGEVIEHNEKSRALFERLGFMLLRRLPKQVARNGSDLDVLVFTMTAGDWRPKKRAQVERIFTAT